MSREIFSPPKETVEDKHDQQEQKKITRRHFLKQIGLIAGVAAAEHIIPASLFAQERKAKTVERDKQEIWRDIQESVEKLQKRFGLQPEDFAIVVDPSHQELHLVRNNEIVKSYLVSTAKNGIGVEEESGKTPWGTHRIKEKIGDGLQFGTIIKARQDTRRITTIYTDRVDVPRDDVTTRILWLDGQEGGSIKEKGSIHTRGAFTSTARRKKD